MGGIITILGSLFGLIGNSVSGFLGFKSKQADVIQGAINTLGDTQNADAAYAQAASESLQALYQYGPPIERLWRPVLMWVLMGIILARFFGYAPAYICDTDMAAIYQWMEIGLIGYMPLRTIEKVMMGFNIGKILQTYVSKKLV